MSEQLQLIENTEHDPACRRMIRMPVHWTVTAKFDGPGNCYRYYLCHKWDMAPMWMWLMMNPSGANLDHLDMTVNKTAAISKRGGAGGQMILNVCAYRCTDRNRLLEVDDPVGPANHFWILSMAQRAAKIVVAHGQLPGELQKHADAAVQLLRAAGHQLHVLRIQNGQPLHPLARGKNHVPVDIPLVAW